MAQEQTDGRIRRGDQTRQAILRRAVDIASAEGLEGLSIGRLATELNISKSGVFTHFGAKEELQLATIRLAVEVFTDSVVRPALAAPKGLRRVWALMEARQAYLERPVFPGGCFFYATSAEFDTRPGRVRDAIAHSQRDWLAFLERCLHEAWKQGELVEEADPPQLAFELDALGRAAGGNALLFGAPEAYTRSRRALLARLRSVAIEPDMLPRD